MSLSHVERGEQMDEAFWERLWVAAQPIVDLSTGDVIGYETLIRGDPSSAWSSPAQLFAKAGKQGQEAELEMQCRNLGLAWGHQHLSSAQMLFLNIHGDYAFLPINLHGWALPPTRIALEISEAHNTLENSECLRQIHHWRDEGYHIVLDDFGVGYAGLGLLLTIQPHMAKIDRLLIAGIDHDQKRQSIIAHLRELARDQGVTLVAEGIETAAELQMLEEMGLPLGQGFFLGRPEAKPVTSPRPGVVITPSFNPPKSWTASLDSDMYRFTPIDHAIFRKNAEIVYATPFPAYVVTRSRRVLAWNEAAAALTGWTRKEMEQHHCLDQRLNHRDFEGYPLCVGVCPLVSTMVKGQAHKQRITVSRADGSRLSVESLSMPLWNPVTQRTIGAIEYFWAMENPSAADLDPSLTRSRPRRIPLQIKSKE